MTAITFDTLKFVETLKASGFAEPQAKGMAVAIQEVQKANLDELATKGDLRELKLELKSDIREVESRLMGEIRLNRWMLALVVAATVLPALKTLLIG
ncbi:MAG: DUF1640 domain-containing protein [Magnetococcales bacterium]|nr:DUF1640 domain-containing protein [Magnetococcales bacterium]